ncbi:MAG TPA: hypothetical protein VE553_11010 [Candidatus Binatia bacterium]|jgi:hypothetical protein|nr:hypothetical protein [Candidatus Binatia bacterium]
MSIEEAQREFRSVFLRGAVGQFVAGIIWLLPDAFSIGGWLAGLALLGYAAVTWRTVVPQLGAPTPT